MDTQTEGSAVIAKFMGERVKYKVGSNIPMVKYGTYSWKPVSDWAKYHSSWDELMPVVEKIEKLGFQFFIHNDGSYIRKWFYRKNFPDFGNVGETKIEATYKTVVQFTQWYNTTNP